MIHPSHQGQSSKAGSLLDYANHLSTDLKDKLQAKNNNMNTEEHGQLSSYSTKENNASIKAVSANDVLYHQLSRRFDFNSDALNPSHQQTQMSSDSIDDKKTFSPDVVADNILNFVKRRASQAQAQGKSEEYVKNMIADAQKGIVQGFNEAKKDLKDLGMLDEPLEESINIAFDKTYQGLEGLYEDLSPDVQDRFQFTSFEKFSSSSKSLSYLPLQQSSESHFVQNTEEYHSESKLNFQLKTLEGDTVSISLNEVYHKSSQFSLNSEERGGASVLSSSFENQESFFHFSVNGELSNEEMKAVDDLLFQVNDLAETFFSGNMSAAFEQAQSIGFDSDQIASFALNLTDIDEVQSSTRVQTPYENDSNPLPTHTGLSGLVDYANQLMDTYQQATSHFNEAKGLLNHLMQSIEIMHEKEHSATDLPLPESAQDDNQLRAQGAFSSVSEQLLGALIKS